MTEAEARSAMLVRAIELTDSASAVWPREERQWATDTALKSVPAAAPRRKRAADREARAFIARRAAIACERLAREHREVARVQRAVRWPGWTWWFLPIAAFALGVASNALGADRRINIVSFPLLGVLAWNLAVYVFVLPGMLAAFSRRGRAPHSGRIARLHAWIARRAAPVRAEDGPLQRGLARFTSEWLSASSRLNNARARTALHLSAALLALGAVAGMYVRGLGFEYLAGWESTFLSADAVHGMLAVILGPASALSGIALPGPEHVASLRWSETQPGEGAARWIHLYALTAALFVVLPRLVLAMASGSVAARLTSSFPLPLEEDRYFRRLLARRSGEPAQVRVIPYGYTPDQQVKAALAEVLTEAFEGPVKTQFEETVPYGEEDTYAPDAAATVPDWIVVLFNMTATPEAENHGVFVKRVQESMGRAPHVLAVVNESSYRERLAGQPDMESRLTERRAGWESVMREHGVPVIAIDIDRNDVSAAAKAIEDAMRDGALQQVAT